MHLKIFSAIFVLASRFYLNNEYVYKSISECYLNYEIIKSIPIYNNVF